MLPIGPLMIEHRLIERMLALLEREAARAESEGNIDAYFLDTALDFMLVYVDRLHHGKEEDILFAELDRKAISDEHRRILSELIEEHGQARGAMAALAEEKERYASGNRESLLAITQNARFLGQLYRRHVDKEDHHFFMPVMQYFSPEEKDLLLVREHEFDRNVIHRIYKELVVREESRSRG